MSKAPKTDSNYEFEPNAISRECMSSLRSIADAFVDLSFGNLQTGFSDKKVRDDIKLFFESSSQAHRRSRWRTFRRKAGRRNA